MMANTELIARLRLMLPDLIGNEAADALEASDKEIESLRNALEQAAWHTVSGTKANGITNAAIAQEQSK